MYESTFSPHLCSDSGGPGAVPVSSAGRGGLGIGLGGGRPPQSSAGRPPISSMGRNNAPASRAGLTTGAAGGGLGGDARPMTSVSGAGFQSKEKAPGNFDPLNMNKGAAAPLAEKCDNSPEDKAKDMEKNVHRLIEASAEAIYLKDMRRGLEKAKEAGKAERSLCKFRDSKGLSEQISLELTFAVTFNIANAYYYNKMYDEAIETYKAIVKNRDYPQAGRLRVNIGNIYFDQKKYPQAIKEYRMALDQIPATNKELRFKIFGNIGNSFVKLGQFQDAIESFESVMGGAPDIQTAFNLLLCLYARGDRDKMRRHFTKMLSLPVPGMTEDDMEKLTEVPDTTADRPDTLRQELQHRHEQTNDRVLSSARLIAPIVEESPNEWAQGYRWVMEQLRPDHETVSSKLEIDVAMTHMKKRQFDDALEVLKGFERKDHALRAVAATNLSFIHFLEGDYQQAEEEADVAMRSDRYNAKALVNKGNCLYVAGNYQAARDMYLEAVGVEADCVEAIYNLGLTNTRLNQLDQARHAFDKLHQILPTVPEALFQLGTIHERKGSNSDLEQAAKTYELLLNATPGDPNLCSRLGLVYEKLEDESTACHWHTEAHRYSPVNLNVISWLGVWYVKREMYEQAIEFFERAAKVQPSEVKWQLMVTSCYRRLGDYNKALELYLGIHEEHPENIEALQYLEALCRDLGRPHDEFSKKLEKLRRSQPQGTAGGGVTRAGGVTAAAPQAGRLRPDRPGRPERSERPSRDTSVDPENDTKAVNESKSPLQAPSARTGPQTRESAPNRKQDDDDDFGDHDVASMLA